MSSGTVILTAVGVIFALSFVGIYSWANRANRERMAALEAIWSRSREVVAAVPPGASPTQAVLTGRPSLAYHVEVVTKETIGRGNHDEIITRRVHEESGGAFADPDGMIDFSHARLTTEADADFGGSLVYSSATSMFAGQQQIPPPVHAFLAQRSLPLPRQDQLFSAGFKVVIRERLITPGTQLWVGGGVGELVFDLGSIEEARRLAKAKQSSPLFEAVMGAVLAGGFTGLICSVALEMFSK